MSVTANNFKVGDRITVKDRCSSEIYEITEITPRKTLRLKDYFSDYDPNIFVKVEEPSFNISGFKDDSSKPDIELLFSSFPRALLEVAAVADHGAKKYTRDGWVEVENGKQRYMSALGRHLLKRYIDGEYDQDSHLRHLAHSAWNALAVLELALRENERPK